MTANCFGRYQVVELLGMGGMADVYKAYDPRLKREVAVKVIKEDRRSSQMDSQLLERFRREITTLAGLSHPNIVKVLDSGEEQNQPYLVMEYISGGSLRERLAGRQGRPYPWEEAARLLAPIARALETAHAEGIIHRDVKPANILFDRNNLPMLSDFGIAKILGSDRDPMLTAIGGKIGTPAYMAPEQAAGQPVDWRIDIYALGVVFFELITGQRPQQATPYMSAVAGESKGSLPRPSMLVSGLPQKIDSILLKALAWDPRDRQANMGELAAELEALAKGVLPRAASPARSNRSSWLAAGGFVFLCILVALVFGLARFLPLAPFFVHPSPSPLPATQGPVLPIVLPTATRARPVPTTMDTATPESALPVTRDGADLLFIPEGEFIMGSDPKEPYFWGAEAPRHTVYLNAYWIYRTEVTNAMYRQCVQAGGCQPPADGSSHTHRDYFKSNEFNEYPVIYMTYADAAKYCAWAGARLPSEAEWEKAARGTDGRLFPWGDENPRDNSANLCDRNCPEQDPKYIEKGLDDGYADVSPVGSFPAGASPYDVLDMAGNAAEWVADWYQVDYYTRAPTANPPGPLSGTRNIFHGGSWRSIREGLRPAARTPKDNGYSSDYTGFRCALDEP
jgi:eukaryotic-like serine/threonine-protein kinase